MNDQTPINEDATVNSEITAQIISAYVAKNPIPKNELPELIADVFRAVAGLSDAGAEETAPKQEPAVNPRRSVRGDHIVCLECGAKFKSLKRHLGGNHDMTPEEYRAKWNLSGDYPMVAPDYAAERSKLAKAIGLGRKPGQIRKSKKRK